MNTGLKKCSAFILIIMLFITMNAGLVFASVEVSDGKAKNLETVTIAGNPDAFPYEYYDEQSGTYKGLFPDLMEIVSEKTGLNFEYVFAGTEDQQLFQAKTGNAEILTAFTKNDDLQNSYNLTYGTTVITNQDENTEIGIAYTRFVVNEADKQINEALSEITPEQILTILSKYAGNKPEKKIDFTVGYIVIALLAAAAAAMAVILIILAAKKKKRKDNEKLDKLTGLYKREYFDSQFDKLVANKFKSIYVIAYIAFDIVRVNSTYGEEAAEEQLKFAAGILKNSNMGANDLLVRYSGGGFVFLHVCSTEKQTEEWIDKIIKDLNAYVKKYEKDYKPLFRGGVYRMEPGHWDRKSAIADAQRSYQYAVDNDLPYYVADPNESARNLIRNHLKERMSKAFTDDEFKQFFQPIVDGTTGSIVGAEALSRWFHPDMGILSPGKYVEMMEEEGTIFELDFLIFEKVCMTLEAWQKEGCDFWISTNFTRITLSSRNFSPKIHEIIDRYEFDHSKCVFEITEDCLENNVDLASQNVKSLNSMGFKIALDDLGSGYTFFSDFINYKINIVKIDRSLLLKADTDEGERLIKGIADLCRNLDMKVLIEGVETKEQLDISQKIECDFIQGFYFYRAMPESDFNNIRQSNNVQ